MFRKLFLTAAAVALTACSTTVKETPPPTSGAARAAQIMNLSIRSVSGSTTADKVTPEVVNSLTEAIRIELGGGAAGGPPADLSFVISDYRVVGNATRFMVGALAGSNRMTVDVTLRDPSGSTLRQFTITRAANTMGVGAFMNQKGSLIGQTAEAVAKTVRGEK
ncbi:hypothetical protein [Phenylobacterium sp.]|jgi:uncharacterized lipoprotein YmbA|uniref:hypothetical protein n=1 Tax=Phenylobacterium sp. TaxID=1871053 RepID=UPI003782E1C6